jgi:tetratricopeptide (TPR) repeat protein
LGFPLGSRQGANRRPARQTGGSPQGYRGGPGHPGEATIPDQQVYFPYLTGYVAFYSGDYAAALADLRNAAQTDPFIQCLIAQCYEKLGDREKALEYYRSAASTTAHSAPAAYARPFASARLE